jgi:hypothetical protein
MQAVSISRRAAKQQPYFVLGHGFIVSECAAIIKFKVRA